MLLRLADSSLWFGLKGRTIGDWVAIILRHFEKFFQVIELQILEKIISHVFFVEIFWIDTIISSEPVK